MTETDRNSKPSNGEPSYSVTRSELTDMIMAGLGYGDTKPSEPIETDPCNSKLGDSKPSLVPPKNRILSAMIRLLNKFGLN